MSYGRNTNGSGIVTVYAVNDIPKDHMYFQSSSFVICRGITHDALTAFTSWFANTFCNGRSKKQNDPT